MKSLLLFLLFAQSWLDLAQGVTYPVMHRKASCTADNGVLSDSIIAAMGSVYNNNNDDDGVYTSTDDDNYDDDTYDVDDDAERNLRLGQRELPNCSQLCQGFPQCQCWVYSGSCTMSCPRRRLGQNEEVEQRQDIPISRRLPLTEAQEYAKCQSRINKIKNALPRALQGCVEGQCRKLVGTNV